MKKILAISMLFISSLATAECFLPVYVTNLTSYEYITFQGEFRILYSNNTVGLRTESWTVDKAGGRARLTINGGTVLASQVKYTVTDHATGRLITSQNAVSNCNQHSLELVIRQATTPPTPVPQPPSNDFVRGFVRTFPYEFSNTMAYQHCYNAIARYVSIVKHNFRPYMVHVTGSSAGLAGLCNLRCVDNVEIDDQKICR